MKLPGWITATFLASTALAIETIPFSPPEPTAINQRALDVLRILRRADNNCPGGYNPCSNFDKDDICCRSDSRCSRDAADNIACCPTGASCTGSLAGSTNTGNSFQFPSAASGTQTTATGANGATITGSTLNGAYPFVYVPTTFANDGICSSYASLCQSEYTACVSQLGGGYGVTVGGGGAGVTRNGGAVSTCSSLSQRACHGLNEGNCEAYNTAQGNGNLAAPRRTTSLEDLFYGMVIGVAGMLI